MKLRQQLQTLGYSRSFTTEEKGVFPPVWCQGGRSPLRRVHSRVPVLFQTQKSFSASSCTRFWPWSLS